ncbi:gamma-glutamylcyclotransferase family protein [Magnetospirillum molischianum]|uniref:Gamma-glutamylcyclotransferase AIG2-like domain-containing protein n=1 Tax=Magnetospirillum molischianum DSM 120 TaxID=1150626 RepID=H8FSG0_MAGML|nr:gamma-glutamylcyclotransferase family protein [Magnetospirillum molischianum]CCG41298.1 conserved exported hypothetical protein [Magnetospirillum molischianum DSM 120]
MAWASYRAIRAFVLPLWLGVALLLAGCARDLSSADDPLRFAANRSLSGPCNSPVEDGRQNFVIGYGSLMQEGSRLRTAPTAGPAIPVEVSGMRRGWFAKGSDIGFTTTFLGAVAQEGAVMNAVAFSANAAEIAAMDRREAQYCRRSVEPENLQSVPGGKRLPPGRYWIYLNIGSSIALATPERPLVQSYVDLFLSGCLEAEDALATPGFARRCIATTTDWSTNWVNDRVYPRRPFAEQSEAGRIDRLLKDTVPTQFEAIRLE